MGMTYPEIITDPTATQHFSGLYFELAGEQESTTANLYNIHEETINNWVGQGGDAFKALAGTIECELMNSVRFSYNASDPTATMASNATQADADRAGSIEVATGQGQSNGTGG